MKKATWILLPLLALVGCGGAERREERREDRRDNPQGVNWEKLGERRVAFSVDHDSIAAGGQGEFRQIKINVEGADLDIFNIVVHFANGERFSPETRFHFDQGTSSRVIDLPGTARHITHIDFFYKTEHRGDGHARVEAWGRH